MTESFSLLSIILRHFIIFSQHMCLASSVTSFLFSHHNPHVPDSKLHKTAVAAQIHNAFNAYLSLYTCFNFCSVFPSSLPLTHLLWQISFHLLIF